MFKSLLGLFPVFLFDFYLRFHEHENWVVTDAEVLREGLLEEVVGCTHVSGITVDYGCEHVGLND